MDYSMDSDMDTSGISSVDYAGTKLSDTARETAEMIDLSSDKSRSKCSPELGKFAVNPSRQKTSAPSTIRQCGGPLTDVFFGSNDYGTAGDSASPSTRQSQRGRGASKSKYTSTLDYFGESEDVPPPAPVKPKRQRLSRANEINDHSKDTARDIYTTPTGFKTRKTAGRFSRNAPLGLFKSPASRSFKTLERHSDKPRKHSDVPHNTNSRPPPSFGPPSRSDHFSTAPQLQQSHQHQPQERPHLTPKSGEANTDVAVSLNFMEEQISRVASEIVQPVVDLTKVVKKLELENKILREKVSSLQTTVEESISEMYERQNEHEDLIDRMRSSSITPAGTPFGGRRYTATKTSGVFHDPHSSQLNSPGGSNTTS